MAEPLIRIKNLYRRFKSGEGEVTILNDLNLDRKRDRKSTRLNSSHW